VPVDELLTELSTAATLAPLRHAPAPRRPASLCSGSVSGPPQWGKELYADATLVEADADREKMLPRFALERHIVGLFGTASEAEELPVADETSEVTSSTLEPPFTEQPPLVELGVTLSTERAARLAEQKQARHDWYATNGEPERSIQRGS
jgi:hypothetical protein